MSSIFRPNFSVRRAFRLGWSFLALAGTAFAAPASFDLPAQAAVPALELFMKQSGAQVAFSPDELKDTRTNAVTGEFEPAQALALLLENTGFVAKTRELGWFVVVRDQSVGAGAVRGALTLPSGDAAAGVMVTVWETAQSAVTDRNGEFFFSAIAPGSYRLVVKAEGYQTLHITDVNVRSNREVALGGLQLRAADEVTKLQPVEVRGEAVERLDAYDVEGWREKPFAAGNMDIVRTIDDVQPYYIFDAQTLDHSGAASVEDFLKQRLTMNTTIQTNGETSGLNTLGNTSSINLRGLGTDKTLILVNGRRLAGVNIGTSDYQADINGIPLSAIERIEVLPSSASGIYGGGAIGGVVNLILKQNYSGGELRLNYDGYWGTSAAKRGASLSYGTNLEGGRTHLTFNASWTDNEPLLLQDVAAAFQGNLSRIQQNYSAFINGSTSPWLGSLPNILPGSSSVTTLTLKDGTVLNSRRTYVPAGTSAATSSTELAAGLLANAGQWKTDNPLTTQSPSGLLRRIGSPASTRYFQGGVRRQMRPGLELAGDFAYSENKTDSVFNPLASYLTVPAAAVTNPFKTDVRVRVPDASEVPMTTRSQTANATIGAIAKLPWSWTGNLDYTWSENRFDYHYFSTDTAGRTADLLSGALNPFVDTLLYPLNLSKYHVPYVYRGSTRLHNVALRGSGPLPELPWGQPVLTVGLERRLAQTPERTSVVDYPITVANSYILKYYAREATTDSAYAETIVPLVKRDLLPGLHALDLQLSGRSERYEVDTGTNAVFNYYKRSSNTVAYSGTTLNGEPYFSKANYTSNNYTLGVKYQPVESVTLRVSRATAFLPPTPTDLLKDPAQSTSTTTVTDPVTGEETEVYTVGGGNPALKPQHSESLNAGLIWEPTWRPLRGLRFNAEYYKIEQFDAITYLEPQAIVNQESLYPGRVTRDSSGTITLVDASALNLYHRETEGWDFGLSYSLRTPVGLFSFNAVETIILHLKNQYDRSLPEYDAVNFPSEDGALKYKANFGVTWERWGWTAGWSVRYFGSYKQFGAAGGPYSIQYVEGGVESTNAYILAGGGDTIPSQTYHDAFVGYTFRSAKSGSNSKLRSLRASLLSGLSVQLNVRNVFDKTAPLDPSYGPYYLSPYGGGLAGLRSYSITLKKEF